MKNINDLRIRHHKGTEWTADRQPKRNVNELSLRDFSMDQPKSADVAVYFDKIESKIVELIQEFEVAVGAVAWLSNPKILGALRQLERVGIVVQKEDFLRMDFGGRGQTKRKSDIRKLYEALPIIDAKEFEETYPGQQEEHPDYNSHVQHNLFDDSGMFQFGGSAVNCLGYSSRQNQTTPKMHHKFLVLGEFSKELVIRPRLVITGSFNMTNNAVRSRENIVVIRDAGVAQRYVSEWSQLWAMSEGLDWTSSEPIVHTVYMGT